MPAVNQFVADHLVTLFRVMTDARAAAVRNSSEASRLAAEAATQRFEEAAREALQRIIEGCAADDPAWKS